MQPGAFLIGIIARSKTVQILLSFLWVLTWSGSMAHTADPIVTAYLTLGGVCVLELCIYFSYLLYSESKVKRGGRHGFLAALRSVLTPFNTLLIVMGLSNALILLSQGLNRSADNDGIVTTSDIFNILQNVGVSSLETAYVIYSHMRSSALIATAEPSARQLLIRILSLYMGPLIFALPSILNAFRRLVPAMNISYNAVAYPLLFSAVFAVSMDVYFVQVFTRYLLHSRKSASDGSVSMIYIAQHGVVSCLCVFVGIGLYGVGVNKPIDTAYWYTFGTSAMNNFALLALMSLKVRMVIAGTGTRLPTRKTKSQRGSVAGGPPSHRGSLVPALAHVRTVAEETTEQPRVATNASAAQANPV